MADDFGGIAEDAGVSVEDVVDTGALVAAMMSERYGDATFAYYMGEVVEESKRLTMSEILDLYRVTPAETRRWSRLDQSDREAWLSARATFVPCRELLDYVSSSLERLHDCKSDDFVRERRGALAAWRKNEEELVRMGKGRDIGSRHVGLASRGTGSTAIHWAGVDGAYDSQEAALIKLMWPQFHGNDMTRWGQEMEPFAEAWMFAQLCDMWQMAADEGHPNPVVEARIEHRGFQTHPSAPFLGCSVDGLLYVRFRNGERKRYVIEYKCPAAVNAETGKRHVYNTLYIGYVVQAVFNSLITSEDGDDVPLADEMIFCVYTPDERRIDFLSWREHDLPSLIVDRMTSFFFDTYLPLLSMRESRMLVPGTIRLRKEAAVVLESEDV